MLPCHDARGDNGTESNEAVSDRVVGVVGVGVATPNGLAEVVGIGVTGVVGVGLATPNGLDMRMIGVGIPGTGVTGVVLLPCHDACGDNGTDSNKSASDRVVGVVGVGVATPNWLAEVVGIGVTGVVRFGLATPNGLDMRRFGWGIPGIGVTGVVGIGVVGTGVAEVVHIVGIGVAGVVGIGVASPNPSCIHTVGTGVVGVLGARVARTTESCICIENA